MMTVPEPHRADPVDQADICFTIFQHRTSLFDIKAGNLEDDKPACCAPPDHMSSSSDDDIFCDVRDKYPPPAPTMANGKSPATVLPFNSARANVTTRAQARSKQANDQAIQGSVQTQPSAQVKDPSTKTTQSDEQSVFKNLLGVCANRQSNEGQFFTPEALPAFAEGQQKLRTLDEICIEIHVRAPTSLKEENI
jgi:hypothetical protein